MTFEANIDQTNFINAYDIFKGLNDFFLIDISLDIMKSLSEKIFKSDYLANQKKENTFNNEIFKSAVDLTSIFKKDSSDQNDLKVFLESSKDSALNEKHETIKKCDQNNLSKNENSKNNQAYQKKLENRAIFKNQNFSNKEFLSQNLKFVQESLNFLQNSKLAIHKKDSQNHLTSSKVFSDKAVSNPGLNLKKSDQVNGFNLTKFLQNTSKLPVFQSVQSQNTKNTFVNDLGFGVVGYHVKDSKKNILQKKR
ncbi:MAG: hypothetical protein JXA94_05295, partial [Parachlamydiales bacterium]|nr:hypothetical protein [Parachlamydiales bacterium]